MCKTALLQTPNVSSTDQPDHRNHETEVLLIGGGIMGATLGTYLQDLEPDWCIEMVERLEDVAKESSNGWNNAGTGHAALAEMNYTPEKTPGVIDISKAIGINESFQISRQFWSYQVQRCFLHNPPSFIRSIPHMSFVWGEQHVTFLRQRYHALQVNHLFQDMEYSEDARQIAQWIPLVMEGRDPQQKVAATRMPSGTDVNFGEITRQLVDSLSKSPQFRLHKNHEVVDIKRNKTGTWTVKLTDRNHRNSEKIITAKYVFIGAGGATLPLLQKSGIPEAKKYAGFPVGGEFLVTENPALIQRHQAKVYGKAATGAPPMSVPHLDTRVVDGKQVLLFGPFATFSTRYLKTGSLLDMFKSITVSNFMPMVRAGLDNINLVRYLISQLMLTEEDRLNTLKTFFPGARSTDWRRLTAGQRVQIISRDAKKGGVLQMGTEVVICQDGTLSALLGASPGASTAADIMLTLLQNVFKEQAMSDSWQTKLRQIIPSYGQALHKNSAASQKVLAETRQVLQLNEDTEHQSMTAATSQ